MAGCGISPVLVQEKLSVHGAVCSPTVPIGQATTSVGSRPEVLTLHTSSYIMRHDPRDLLWVGTSRDDLCRFLDRARRIAGYELFRVQQGLAPDDMKPMPDVGRGVQEIRVRCGSEHRVFYVAKFREAVYVLHAFEKTTRATARRDIELGRDRYRIALRHSRSMRGACARRENP